MDYEIAKCIDRFYCNKVKYSGNNVQNINEDICEYLHPGENNYTYMKRLGYIVPANPEIKKSFRETYKHSYCLCGR
jgi:hypothetical protein